MKPVVFLDCSSEDTMLSAQSYSVRWTLRTGSESFLLHLDTFMYFILSFYRHFHCVSVFIHRWRRDGCSSAKWVRLCFRCSPERVSFMMLTGVIALSPPAGSLGSWPGRREVAWRTSVTCSRSTTPSSPPAPSSTSSPESWLAHRGCDVMKRAWPVETSADQQISSNELKDRFWSHDKPSEMKHVHCFVYFCIESVCIVDTDSKELFLLKINLNICVYELFKIIF